ncbi:MAG: uracil-DNA glycosylase family protein [Candidatus Hadarchaeales archaeon]
MSSLKDLKEIQIEISKCKDSECANKGIVNEPECGRIPRGLYVEDPGREADVIVVGFNPGPVGSIGGRPYTIINPEKKLEKVGKLVAKYEELPEPLPPLPLLEKLKKCLRNNEFNERNFYKECLHEELRYLAPVISFELTRDWEKGYFGRMRKFIETFCGKVLELNFENINICWTNLVKCEGDIESIKANVIHQRCSEKFLRRELELYKAKHIFTAGKDALNFLKTPELLKDRYIIGIPHPTGRSRPLFNDLLKKIETCCPEALKKLKEAIESKGAIWLLDEDPP